jgi:hypothetical protein
MGEIESRKVYEPLVKPSDGGATVGRSELVPDVLLLHP